MNASQVKALLRAKFPAAEYALFFEVRNATGFPRNVRSADALAMSLWPSRGLEVHGFEIKVSRSDWLRELKEPAKAEEISKFCHRWWIVAGDSKIVKDDELPPTWGLLAPKGEKSDLVVHRQAPSKEAQPFTPALLASVLRSAQSSDEALVNTRVQAGVVARIDDERKHYEGRIEKARAEAGIRVKELEARIKKFQDASGVTLDGWDSGNVGEAVRIVRAGGVERLREEAKRAIEELQKITKLT